MILGIKVRRKGKREKDEPRRGLIHEVYLLEWGIKLVKAVLALSALVVVYSGI
jgi:hypothetical protein